MTLGAPGSLARHLWTGLSLHSLAILAAVGAVVYGWVHFNLEAQQQELLARQRTQVEHLFDEARQGHDAALLSHKIGDVLVGQTLLGIDVRQGDGQLFFRKAGGATAASSRALAFDVPPLDGATVPWRVRLVLDTTADTTTLRVLAMSLAAAAALGALLVSVGGAVLVRRGLRPVGRLVDQARSLSAATRDRRLDGTAQPAELVPLVQQFNGVLTRLHRAFDHQEAFNADVAHELATPLATLIGSTEIALRRERPADELRTVLSCNLEELQRLARIVQDMLFLARADHGTRARVGPVERLAALVHRVVAFHEAALEERGLSVRITGDAVVAMDGALVERAVSNLLSNATRHARAGSTVGVAITREADAVHLRVTNDGATIPEAHLGRLFERFYRGDAAREGADRHHGLGLSIVAAIAAMHGGSTFVASSDGRTAVGFSVPGGG